MAPRADQVLDGLRSLLPPMPELSAREKEQEMEAESFEGSCEAEAEEGEMIGEATSSHYSPLVDRLFSAIRSAAEGSKAPNTLSGYRGYFNR